MAASTPTELAREVQRELAVLRAEFNALNDELVRTDLARLRERVGVIDDRVNKLEKAKEESEKRHWQFVYIVMGAALALLSSLVVNLLLPLVKK